MSESLAAWRSPRFSGFFRAHDHPVAPARHPRHVGFHERHRHAEIQRLPAPAVLAQIKIPATGATDAAAIALPPARPRHHDDLSLVADPHILDPRKQQERPKKPPRPDPRLTATERMHDRG
jgi:hypothetical protein